MGREQNDEQRETTERKPKARAKRVRAIPPLGLFAYVVVIGLVLLVYGKTVFFDYTGTDDVTLIRDDIAFLGSDRSVAHAFSRPFFPASAGRGEVYYRPLVTISFIFDYAFGDGGLTPFHVTNILLHALASVLLFHVVVQSGTTRRRALLATSIFVIHPALTETVAWIPGRCDSLLAVFAFASLLCLQRYLDLADRHRIGWHFFFFGLALLTKEVAVALPVVFAAYAVLVKRDTTFLREKRVWAGWAGAIGVFALLRHTALDTVTNAGLAGRARDAALAAPIVLKHLGKLVFPTKLSVLAVDADTPIAGGIVAAGLALLALVLLRGDARRRFGFGLVWFTVFILPTLLVSDYLILENRLYVPAAGVLVAMVAVADDLLARRPGSAGALRAAAYAALGVLAWTSYAYADEFRNPQSFTRAAVSESPHSALAHLNRATHLLRLEKDAEAEPELVKALELNPKQSVVHNNLGIVYMRRHDNERAATEFLKEIEINPNYPKAHLNLGLALRNQGKTEEADKSFARARALDPTIEIPAAQKEMTADEAPVESVMKVYEDALARDPKNTFVRLEYAKFCMKKNAPCAKEQFAILQRDMPGGAAVQQAFGAQP